MRKALYAILLLVISASCKKEFAKFQSSGLPDVHPLAISVEQAISEIPKTQVFIENDLKEVIESNISASLETNTVIFSIPPKTSMLVENIVDVKTLKTSSQVPKEVFTSETSKKTNRKHKEKVSWADVLAISSFWLGITSIASIPLGLLGISIFPLLAVLAIAAGVVALIMKAKKRKMAVWGVILGALPLLLILALVILFISAS